MAQRFGVSCNWSAGSGPRRTGGSGAVTSAVDGVLTGITVRPTRYPLPMLIKARLKDHGFDLMTLAELFREGEPTVAEDAQGYYLSFTGSEELFRDAARLHEAASLLLHWVNGVALLHDSEFRPVELVGRFSDEIGEESTAVFAESAEARMRFSATAAAVDGQQQPPVAPGPGYVQLGRTDPDVDEVLRILGKADPAPGWGDIYKVLEIVCKNVTGLPGLKGLPRLKEMSWVSPAQLEAVKASANHQAISGDLARHARMEGTPRPSRVMTPVEGRQTISVLVKAWMDWIRLTSSPAP
jgi:hypothetical protein